MPTITFKAGDEYALKLSKLSQYADGIAKRAIFKGGEVVGDAIRQSIESMPEEPFRRLKEGESFGGTPKSHKLALLRGFGMTPMERDKNGDWNTKAGFAGYTEYPSKTYPNGLPVPMLARAIEGGSSVRRKYPFVRNAVNASKAAAVRAMEQSIDEDIKNIMKK